MAEINQPQLGRRPAKLRSKKWRTSIDMTPMVDLAFLLLTFFILTTTLNKRKAIEIVAPEEVKDAHPPAITADRVLTLVLSEKDKAYWRQGMSDAFQRIAYSQIKKLLVAKNKEMDRMVLFIKSTSKTRYQNFVDIMDDVAATEIERYYIVDVEPEEELLITKTSLHQTR